MDTTTENISFAHLVTLVKNQCDQLAAYSEDMKKLRAENALLQREVHAKREDDRMLFTAQSGRISNLEKLVESKFEAVNGKVAAMENVGRSDTQAKTDNAALGSNGTAKQVCESCNVKHSKMHEELKALTDKIEQIETQLQRSMTALENKVSSTTTEAQSQIDAIKAKLNSPLTTDELLQGQARI